MESMWNHSMESIWNQSMEFMLDWAKQVWIPSSFHMEQSRIPYGIDHSMAIPYGIQGDYGTSKWLGPHLEIIPYGFHGMGGGFHGFHMDSIWINPGSVKTSCSEALPTWCFTAQTATKKLVPLLIL